MTAANNVIIDACARNRESADCRAQDARLAKRPDAITPDMVVAHPSQSTALFSENSWQQYWTDRFGGLGRALAPTVFTHLESRDAIPGDGYLDLSSVPFESAEFVFDHLHPFGENPDATQKALNAMRADVVLTQKRLVPLYVSKVGAQYFGVTETGVVRTLVGDDLTRAWDEMQKAYPDQDVARMVVDAKFFSGLAQNDLNPDRKGRWAPMVYNGASIAASGGVGVFDPTQEITAVPYSTRMSGFGPSELDNFITVFSAALLILAMFRRGGGASAPVAAIEPGAKPKGSRFKAELPPWLTNKWTVAMAMRGRGIPNLFMSGVRRVRDRLKPEPAPEIPVNTRHQVPEGVTMANMPPTSRSYVQGPMTMRPITRHTMVAYVTDSAGPSLREGFVLLRESEGLPPIEIPIDMVRTAVLQGQSARTPFNTRHKMPSVPFRNSATGETLRISPIWNLKPNPGQSFDFFDPHAQIVGVVVKNARGEMVLSLPWVDGWMEHSPMTYEPLRDAPHSWIVPQGWNGRYLSLSQRTEAAAAPMERIPLMGGYLTPQRQEALAMVAAAVASPKMEPRIARWAVKAVMHGRRSTAYLADQVADVVRDFPVEWAFDRPLDVGLDARMVFTPRFMQTIKARVMDTHDVFPALRETLYLFPPPGGIRPYVPQQRPVRPTVGVQPHSKK